MHKYITIDVTPKNDRHTEKQVEFKFTNGDSVTLTIVQTDDVGKRAYASIRCGINTKMTVTEDGKDFRDMWCDHSCEIKLRNTEYREAKSEMLRKYYNFRDIVIR